MAIYKLNAQGLQEVQYAPKELSEFWKLYFANISIRLNKLFFKYTRENITFRFVQRDIVTLKDYFKDIDQDAIIQPFSIKPYNDLGFMFMPQKLTNYLIENMLGGLASSEEATPIYRSTTDVDRKLVENIMDEVLTVMLMQFKEDHREVSFVKEDPGQVLFYSSSLDHNKLISIQQFMVMTPSNTFVFDIAFANRVLEHFVLL